jgi:hypothetical protein
MGNGGCIHRVTQHVLYAKRYLLVEELDLELRLRGRPPHVEFMVTGTIELCSPRSWRWSSPSIESTGLLNEAESTDTWFSLPILFLSPLNDNSFLLLSISSRPDTKVESDILLSLVGGSGLLPWKSCCSAPPWNRHFPEASSGTVESARA